MRVLAAVLAVVLVGCSSGVVPLDADGGGNPPSTCPAVITSAEPQSRLGVSVGGVRTVSADNTMMCRPDAAGSMRYTCTFDASLHAPDVRLVIRWRHAPTAATQAQGQDFDLERVSAPNATDSSAWGGNLRFSSYEPDAAGAMLTLSAGTLGDYAQACSAAGSALTIATGPFYFCTQPGC